MNFMSQTSRAWFKGFMTVNEYDSCGIEKLTEEELKALKGFFKRIGILENEVTQKIWNNTKIFDANKNGIITLKDMRKFNYSNPYQYKGGEIKCKIFPNNGVYQYIFILKDGTLFKYDNQELFFSVTLRGAQYTIHAQGSLFLDLYWTGCGYSVTVRELYNDKMVLLKTYDID